MEQLKAVKLQSSRGLPCPTPSHFHRQKKIPAPALILGKAVPVKRVAGVSSDRVGCGACVELLITWARAGTANHGPPPLVLVRPEAARGSTLQPFPSSGVLLPVSNLGLTFK